MNRDTVVIFLQEVFKQEFNHTSIDVWMQNNGQTISGFPAMEIKQAFRIVAHTHRLPEMAKRLKRLEETMINKTDSKD